VIPFKSPLHRTAAIVAGTFLGLVGAAVFAAPANAHAVNIEHHPECQANGEWTATWQMTPTVEFPKAGVINTVTLDPAGALAVLTVTKHDGTKVPVPLIAKDAKVPLTADA
jgi:hypothetical protein